MHQIASTYTRKETFSKMNKELLTVNDICHELGIGKTTAYKLIKTKKIKSGKIGQKILVRRKELEAYISRMIDGK